MSRHQQDFRVGASLDDGLQQLHSIAAWKNQVKDGNVGLLLYDEFEAFFGIRRRQDL